MSPIKHDTKCEAGQIDPVTRTRSYSCRCAERAYTAFIAAGGDRIDPCWRDHFHDKDGAA